MKDNYRYIVYVKNADEGYYYSYYTEKESNKIEDIIAIFRTEEKAKNMCKEKRNLGYKQIIWEE